MVGNRYGNYNVEERAEDETSKNMLLGVQVFYV